MTTIDAGERKAAWKEIQTIWNEQGWFVWLPILNVKVPVSDRFGNVQPSVMAHRILWNIDRYTSNESQSPADRRAASLPSCCGAGLPPHGDRCGCVQRRDSSACRAAHQAAAERWPLRRALRARQTNNPKTFNANDGERDVIERHHRSSVRVRWSITTTARSSTSPELAKSWEVAPDGVTWTFHLRKGRHSRTGIR